MKPPCAAYGAFPLGGRHPWPGKASSTLALASRAPGAAAVDGEQRLVTC